MQKSLDEWFAEFQALCLSGYFVTGDGATKFRAMEQANTKLKETLRRFYDDVKGPPPKPAQQPAAATQPAQPTVTPRKV